MKIVRLKVLYADGPVYYSIDPKLYPCRGTWGVDEGCEYPIVPKSIDVDLEHGGYIIIEFDGGERHIIHGVPYVAIQCK